MSKKCAPSMVTNYMTSAVSVTSDIYLVVIPIPVVMSLHIPMEKKIRICSLFMLGVL
jgi:hypothetical protein